MLQTLGRIKQDISKVERAVRLFRDVEEATRTNTNSMSDAGRMRNLANCLKDLASVCRNDPDGMSTFVKAVSEGRAYIERAIQIYQNEQDQPHLEDALEILKGLEALQ